MIRHIDRRAMVKGLVIGTLLFGGVAAVSATVIAARQEQVSAPATPPRTHKQKFSASTQALPDASVLDVKGLDKKKKN